MSTRSTSTDLVPQFTDPESVIHNHQRNLGDPSLLLDFEEINMANNNNVQGPPPTDPNILAPDLCATEELLQAPTDGVGDEIVVPPVLASQIELKIALLNLVTAISFHDFDSDDSHSHIQRFTRITQTIKLNQVLHDIIKLILFPFSLEEAARTWLEKESPNSITTWNDLVSNINFFNTNTAYSTPSSIRRTQFTQYGVLGYLTVSFLVRLLHVKMDDPNINMEEYIRIEEEKARRNGKEYNWETATYSKIWYDEDVHNLRSVETEFPAIVFDNALTSKVTPSYEPTVSSLNDIEIDFRILFDKSDDEDYTVVFDKNSDALRSKSDFSTEPTLCPQHIDEFNLKDETSLCECDKKEENVLYFNDLFLFNVIYSDDLKSDEENNDDKIDIKQSLMDMFIIPLPNVINTEVGAYARGSNMLLDTSHDTSNKIFKTETFIKELNVNIVASNYLNKGIAFIFLIKNLYVPFGIPFDPKLFYKDGIKLGQV
uniref:Reverse transcriptase domain-containing protein n=1 Tax=Tanacetum cinerariifolium TaxID=118510 RepID=A0A6L2LLS6_TANCI|nr:reverse transcriptase domain-containing protein [Tanacetum cinerariifolium]